MTKDATARHAARLQVRSHILVEESVKTSPTTRSPNKTRHKNYRKFWDGGESDTASEAFALSSSGCKLASTTIPTTVARPWRPLRARTMCGSTTRRGGRRGLAHAPREATPVHHGRFEADQTLVPRDDALSLLNVSPHFSEGKGSRVNVVPSEAGFGVKFLQKKEKMKADVEALLDRTGGPKSTRAALTAAMDQLRRRNGTGSGFVLKTCSPEYNKRWNPKLPWQLFMTVAPSAQLFLCGVEMQLVLFWLNSTRVHAFRGKDRDLPLNQNNLLGDIGNTRKNVLDLLTRCEHVEKTQFDGMQCGITEVSSELERLENGQGVGAAAQKFYVPQVADPESFSEVGHSRFQSEALKIPRRVDVQHHGEGARRANWCRRLWAGRRPSACERHGGDFRLHEGRRLECECSWEAFCCRTSSIVWRVVCSLLFEVWQCQVREHGS